MVEEQFGKYMIIGEVGLNHLGKEDYANDYINFHLNNNFDCLSFQIRESKFYHREEKKHLQLDESFYEKIANKYCNILHKKIGLSVSNLDSIKNNTEFKATPVIMLSSKDGLFDKAKGRIVGSDQYLTKPFSKGELLEAIQTHVQSAQAQ